MGFNLLLFVFLGLYLGWISILFWVDKNANEKELENRTLWTTLVFFTGPLGLGIYLFSQKPGAQRCRKCKKKIRNIDATVCPYCKERLSDEVVANAFLEQLKKFEDAKFRVVGKDDSNLSVLPDTPEKSISIKSVKMIIANAIDQNVTDIHFEPDIDTLRIRYRLDGVLHEVTSPPRELQGPIVPCIKAMSDIDVAERRKPLDGRMQVLYADRRTDIRVSTSPTIHGEKAALRILDQRAALIDLDKLGMTDNIRDKFHKLINNPQGMLLVTGPTGSGKTTTLYAAITTLDKTSSNIMSIEDPVEYQLSGVTQIPINVRADVTFANGLRSILRQDPDVIMVGEIRDKDTAEIALRAALTGHLIFSTLHTNDSVGAVIRLMDIGMEPYLISSALLGVMAQRLVRVNCQHCKIPESPSPDLLMELGIPVEERMRFYKGKGCKECKFTGYTGRTAIFELLTIDDETRKLIDARASSVAIRDLALKNGMTTMLQDGIEKALAGLTSLSEVTSTVNIK